MEAVRRSHSTSSKGFTPGRVKNLFTANPDFCCLGSGETPTPATGATCTSGIFFSSISKRVLDSVLIGCALIIGCGSEHPPQGFRPQNRHRGVEKQAHLLVIDLSGLACQAKSTQSLVDFLFS